MIFCIGCKRVPRASDRIDLCLKPLIPILNNRGVRTLASCCGHGVYPVSVIIDVKGFPVDIFTGIRIPRKKKFYMKDSTGLYYIPELTGVRTIFKKNGRVIWERKKVKLM